MRYKLCSPCPQRRLRRELVLPILLISLVCLSLWGEMQSATPMDQFVLRAFTMKDSAQIGLTSSRYPISNVVLMGQFNYDVGPVVVKTWAKIWSKYFKNIVVVGPFSVATNRALQSAGIQVRSGRSDKGFVSPYQNLLKTMLEFHHRTNDKNDSSPMDEIDGVLYAHDDALLNITRLFDGDTDPVRTIIRTANMNASYKKIRRLYSIYVERQRLRWSDGKEEDQVSPVVYFEFTPRDDDTINRTKETSIDALVKLLPKWYHWTECLQQQVQMLSTYDETWWEAFSDFSSGPALSEKVINLPNNRRTKLTSQVISRNSYQFSFPPYRPSDFLYMPLKYTTLFAQAARPHIKSGVFLECAFPTILQWVTQAAKKESSKAPKNETLQNDPDLDDTVAGPPILIKEVRLCTDWSQDRGTDTMISNCLRSSSDWGMFHPKKLGKMGRDGATMYEMWLDQIQRPPTDTTFPVLDAALESQNSTKANATDSIPS